MHCRKITKLATFELLEGHLSAEEMFPVKKKLQKKKEKLTI